MAQQKSRPKRWQAAIARMRTAFNTLQSAKEEFEAAVEDLRGVHSEYEEWHGNLPENLQNGTLGEKLQAVVDLDMDSAEVDLSGAETLMDEAEGIDLPLGFGRD